MAAIRTDHGEDIRKKRSENWTDEETFTLISLWKEFVDDLRACKRNRKIYAKMVDRLEEAGVRKTVENVKTKLQNLTTAYRKEKARLEISSSSDSCSSWKFWTLLDAILGQQPIANSDNNSERTQLMESHNNPSMTNGSSSSSPAATAAQKTSRLQVHLRLRSRRRPTYAKDVIDNMMAVDNLQVQLDEDSKPWSSDQSDCATSDATNDRRTDPDTLLYARQTNTRKRRRAAVAKRSDYLCERLLEEAKRGNDILESIEKSTLDIFKEMIAGQKRALELQNTSLGVQQALLDCFLRSHALPPVDQ